MSKTGDKLSENTYEYMLTSKCHVKHQKNPKLPLLNRRLQNESTEHETSI